MRLPRTPLALLSLLLALVLVAASCGDDGDASVGDDDTSSEEDTEPDGDDPTDEDEDEGEDDDPTDEDEGDEGTSEDGGEDPPVGGDSGAYCAISAEQNAQDDDFNVATATPEEAERYFTEGRDRLREAIDVAPEEIRGDLQVILEQIETFSEVLAENDWDFFASMDELGSLLENAEMDAADSRLEEFDEDVCGIVPDDELGATPGTGEDSPDDLFSSPETFEALLGSEFGRQAFAEGMAESGDIDVDQALCLVDSLDFEALFALGTGQGEPTADQLSGLFDAFGTCGISPEQLIG